MKRKCFMLQKIAGIIMLIATIGVAILLDGDATHAIIMIPISLYLFTTKENHFKSLLEDFERLWSI